MEIFRINSQKRNEQNVTNERIEHESVKFLAQLTSILVLSPLHSMQ